MVDEAHNLVDAVNGVHTAQLSLHQLTAAAAQLSSYFQRFRSRLAAGLTLPCYVIDTAVVTAAAAAAAAIP